MTIMSASDTPTAKAKRLKILRTIAELSSRPDMAKRCGISVDTLRMWENPRSDRYGLTEKGAERIVKAVKQMGIDCTVQWLMEGLGDPPKTHQEISEQVVEPLQKIISVPAIDWGEDETIHKEIKFFQELNKGSIVIGIHDNAMSPYLNVRDYVGGIKRYDNDITKYISTICIVETEDGSQLCRRLDKGSGKIEDTYTLSCINPLPSIATPIIHDIKLRSIAQVVWIRKVETQNE